jgi:hypothetical protein
MKSTREGGQVAQRNTPRRCVRINTKHVGMLLDSKRALIAGRVVRHGHASATAVKLLAIKNWHAYESGKAHTLNDKHVKNHYGIGWRRFQEGISLLKRTGVLVREQLNHRAYATERLTPGGRHYVELDANLLKCKPVLFTFIVVVNMCPNPIRPAAAARRFGITSDTTIRELVCASVGFGAVALDINTGDVARADHRFELAAKNGVAKNGSAKNDRAKSGVTQKKLQGTHKNLSNQQDDQEDFQKKQQTENSSPGGTFGEAERSGGQALWRKFDQKAFSCFRLLRWLLDTRAADDVDFDGLRRLELLAVSTEMPDSALRAEIFSATAGRVARQLVNAEGLYAVRFLAALLLYRALRIKGIDDGSNISPLGPRPRDALTALLQVIRQRIGDRPPARLISLELVGKRIVGDMPGIGREPPRFYSSKIRQARSRGQRTSDVEQGAGVAEEAFEFYNKTAREDGFVPCERLTPARRRRLLKRISEIGGLEYFKRAVKEIYDHDLLMGLDREGFEVNFDMLLSTSGDYLGDVLASLLDRALKDGEEWQPINVT